MKKPTGRGVNIKLVASVALCGFSVVVCAVGTMAWFSARRVSNSDNGSIQVVSPTGIFSKMYIHPCLTEGDSVHEFDINYSGYFYYDAASDSVKPSSNDLTITMGTYDLLDRHHPLLLVIELNQEYTVSNAIPVAVYGQTSEIFIGARNPNQNPVAVSGNPLSSVVEFFSYGYSATGYTAICDADSINVPISNTTNSFVDFDEEDGTGYVRESVDFYRASNGDTVKYITIVLDYYEAALEYIYNVFLGNEILDDRIGFTCDWEMII